MTAAVAELDDVAPRESKPSVRPRLESVDLVRGAVMVLMVLDHTREFFGDIRANPVDLRTTTVALFLTRWVTHFCAPAFVFVAGTGAYLAGSRGKRRGELARFLLTRGLWLIFLELTVIRFGLTFDPAFRFIPLTVIWAIGVSMVVLSALIYLPTRAIAAIGVMMIVGHNALDGITPASFGPLAPLWSILHQPGQAATIVGRPIFALYPLIPWVGVMAAGYAFGGLFEIEAWRRRTLLLGLGSALSAAFVVLRYANVYGDPTPWAVQATPTFTVLSFLNCQKYPPSLLYLLMTLGPVIVALGVFDRGAGRLGRPLVTLGRVPLFYYILQWYLLHVLAVIVALASGHPYLYLLGAGPFQAPPDFKGYSLPFVYAMWAVTMILLYPPCAWFADLKRRRRDAWLSYL